jgi:hypothetical protein
MWMGWDFRGAGGDPPFKYQNWEGSFSAAA